MILMVGGGRDETSVEQNLRRARQAAARDLIDQALGQSGISPLIVVSDSTDWLKTLSPLPLELVLSDASNFLFGDTLTDLIEHYHLQACLYWGGGSAPLMSDAMLSHILHILHEERPVLVTNNVHSADWAAFAPAPHILSLARDLETDNALAWVWQEASGYPVHVLPRSSATQMDIDTPFDLLALARHPAVHPHLREFLDQLDWPAPHLDAALQVLRQEATRVIIAGRVSSWSWHLVERNTRAWVRVFAEERGMRASGRQRRGEARSLLNDYLDLVGIQKFFPRLAKLADAVLLANRVILASRGLWPSDADRFHADLMRAEKVKEPFLQALTEAARSAPIPVVMGGHSLVAGGLGALLEGAGIAPLSHDLS
jgi:hypothetical protein